MWHSQYVTQQRNQTCAAYSTPHSDNLHTVMNSDCGPTQPKPSHTHTHAHTRTHTRTIVVSVSVRVLGSLSTFCKDPKLSRVAIIAVNNTLAASMTNAQVGRGDGSFDE